MTFLTVSEVMTTETRLAYSNCLLGRRIWTIGVSDVVSVQNWCIARVATRSQIVSVVFLGPQKDIANMRSSTRWLGLVPCVLFLASGCASDSTLEPKAIPPSLVVGGGCPLPFLTSGILEPIHGDNSSSFQLGRTIPVKIRITDCVTGGAVNTLAPNIALALVDLGGGPVNDLVSSSAADDGTTMRNAGDGQYIFNLSTKRSQFNAGQDLRPGIYQLTISSPADFADVVVQFAIRP